MPWAELIDQLARELDIVIVISSGNVSEPAIPTFTSRQEFQQKCKDQLFSSEYRLIDPTTAALGITVGSITRFEEPDDARYGITRLSAGEKRLYVSLYTCRQRG